MTKLNKKQQEELDRAIHSINGLIAACNGDESSCVVFSSLNKDYKQNIALYTSTWCLAPLERLKESLTNKKEK